MALDLLHVNDISKAIRGLCLGRVYLKGNCAVGATSLIVGTEDPNSLGQDIPGSQFFRNRSLAATLVQPTASDVPDAAGVSHSEAVTLVEPTWCPLHLTLAAATTKAYTTARGAYVRLTTLPSVCSGLRMIVKDFTEDMVAPEEKYLPGIFVTWMGTGYNSTHITAYGERAQFLVRYALLEETDRDNRSVLVTGLEQLTNLIGEDNYLGGTVHESNVARVTPSWAPENQRRGLVLDAAGRQVIWGDIIVNVVRTVSWDKVSVA